MTSSLAQSPGQAVLTDAQLLALVAEDVPHGDLTTDMLGIGGRPGRIVFRARSPITLCGTEEAARMLQLAGATATYCVSSGTKVAASESVIEAHGNASQLHRVWKVAQTLVEYASGIATTTAAIVDALRHAGCDVPVACTRKHFPGTKTMAVKAVGAGGGIMHRLGLSETLLVFPEHRDFLGQNEAGHAVTRLRKWCPEVYMVRIGSAKHIS